MYMPEDGCDGRWTFNWRLTKDEGWCRLSQTFLTPTCQGTGNWMAPKAEAVGKIEKTRCRRDRRQCAKNKRALIAECLHAPRAVVCPSVCRRQPVLVCSIAVFALSSPVAVAARAAIPAPAFLGNGVFFSQHPDVITNPRPVVVPLSGGNHMWHIQRRQKPGGSLLAMTAQGKVMLLATCKTFAKGFAVWMRRRTAPSCT